MEYNIFQKIKDNSSILEIASHYGIQLNRSYMCRCIFHNEKTASFSINPKKQIFKCFSCGKGGDVINLVQLIENCSAIEAAKKINYICNCGINFEQDKSKPKFEYDKEYAEYKKKKKEENQHLQRIHIFCNELYKLYCQIYRYWHNLSIDCEKWNIEYFSDEISIIYRNLCYFENFSQVFENFSENEIYEMKEKLINSLERGIRYMDFEKISLLAYNEQAMPKNSSNIELLIYYMLKELYVKHYSKKISEENAKSEKNRIKSIYESETRLEEFDRKLKEKISNNILSSEDDVVKIIKMINENKETKEILDIAIDCIYKLTSNTALKQTYEQKY